MMVVMDTNTFDLREEVTPVVGFFKGRKGKIVTLIPGDAWRNTIYEVRIEGHTGDTVRYIASDLKRWGHYSKLELAQLRLAALVRGEHQTGVEVKNIVFDGLRYCPFCHRVSSPLRPEWHAWDCPNGLLRGEDPGDYVAADR